MFLRTLQYVIVGLLMVLWAVKAVDYNASLVTVLFPRSKVAWCLSRGGHHWRDPAWTLVFAWAARHKKAGGARGLLVKIIDSMFRLPVLSGLQSLAALVALELAHSHSKGCGTAYRDWTDWLWLVVACASVVAAVGIPVFFLAVAIRGRTQHYRRSSGHAWMRTAPGGKAMNPLVSVIATTLTLILSYAALYRATWVVWPKSFSFESCAHQGIDAVYFSVVTAATVGFGEIHPTRQAAELVVASQIIVTAVALALYVQAVIASRD